MSDLNKRSASTTASTADSTPHPTANPTANPTTDAAPRTASQAPRRRVRSTGIRTAPAAFGSNTARLWRIGIAAATAVAIFALDALTPLDIAIAVLYVVVLLIIAPVCSQRSMLAVCCTLLVMTVVAFVMSHSGAYTTAPIGRCTVSLAAIAITAFLSLKNIAATDVLREQVLLLDLTSDAIFVNDMQRVICYWNRGAEALYGWTADEAAGNAAHELVHTVYPRPLAEIYAELLRTGHWEGELTQTRRDQSQVIVASRWSLRRDAQGQAISVLVTNNDITQRKRMESEIQRQQQEIRAAIDAIPAMVWISSPDGRPVFVNERWSELGLSLDRMGPGWLTLVHPADLPQMERDWASALATGTPFENVSRLRRGDGTYRWLLLRALPLLDDSGQTLRWYGVNTDIEDHKRATEALERSEAFLAEAETLSETGSIGFAVPGFNMFWSEQAYRIYGYDRTVKPALDLMLTRIHPDDHARVSAVVQSLATGKRDIDSEHRLTMPDGAVKQVHLVAHAIELGDGTWEYRGALMDVTEARRVQDALHQSLAELAHVTRVTTLGELSASIAHEVSQPIAAIMSNGDAGLRWLERPEPQLSEVREALHNMVRDARRAGDIVQRIRALAKKSAPNRAPFELNALIEESVVLIQREIGNHLIAPDLRLAASGLLICGDRVQLQQVVINLMMNAIQAMSTVAGRPRRLLVRSARLDAGEVLVEIEDVGPGIAAEDLQRLFQPFFTTRTEGMGMGLSICRSIVESHGGRIWATSQPGEGATLYFVLPTSDGEAVPA